MHATVRPHTYVALRLPSDSTKILQIVPNTTISLGKYGSFPANQIIGRPYHMTFEFLDEPDEKDGHRLRIVSAAELHTEALIADDATPGEPDEGEGAGASRSALAGDGEESGNNKNDHNNVRTNQNTVDDTSTQRMTMKEIEVLKQRSTGAGKEIITKLLESHSALDQKTSFSRAKYMLRKRKKYMRRFTVMPVDVSLLTNWMLEERDAGKMMELRNEMLGLIGSWANVHYTEDQGDSQPTGRWLVVDDTGGLVVAAMAERMGILHPSEEEDVTDDAHEEPTSSSFLQTGGPETAHREGADSSTRRSRHFVPAMSATNSTLTVVHPNIQPNLTVLKYFSFDVNSPDESHPLYTRLKALSWMQLLDPHSDSIYSNEPPRVSDETLSSWKSNKRGVYYRKHKRHQRVRRVVDETRAGGFDGLIVASQMDPISILKHMVPLLSGSAPVVVYSPYIEPLVGLADLYSTARRAAYITLKKAREEKAKQNGVLSGCDNQSNDEQAECEDYDQEEEEEEDRDFPVDPTLLLGATVQTSRVRVWQALPGRSHPMMTGRGGAEGYLFHATRVIPVEGRVEARGLPGRKRRKIEPASRDGGNAGKEAVS